MSLPDGAMCWSVSDSHIGVTLVLAYIPSNGTLFFGNNIKSKMGILNLIRKIYFSQKTLTKNIFLKFVYFFINAGIGWNFNILKVYAK